MQLPDSQQAAARIKSSAPKFHQHRGGVPPFHIHPNTGGGLREKVESAPEKRKKHPLRIALALATYGVTRSLADSAGSAGYGE